MEMTADLVLPLLKERIGLKTSIRDTYLTAIAQSVIDELTNQKGLSLDGDSPTDLLFCVDMATWRHESRDSKDGMPLHIKARLHDMMIHNKKD